MNCNKCGKPRKVINNIAHGVVASTKFHFKVNRADQEVIDHRKSVCETCPSSLPKDKKLSLRNCGKLSDVLDPNSNTCGCPLMKKYVLKGETCPQNKW